MKTNLELVMNSPKQPKKLQELFDILQKECPILYVEFMKYSFGGFSYLESLKSFLESKGLYLHIGPEFYHYGINWVWQWYWYLPEEKWAEYKIEAGTSLYGDNAEYSTRPLAELGAFEMGFRLLENGLVVGISKEEKNEKSEN